MSILNKFSLEGKTALVTGCKRGIGKAMAIGLAEAGADIIGVSATLEKSGSDVEKAVLATGKKFKALLFAVLLIVAFSSCSGGGNDDIVDLPEESETPETPETPEEPAAPQYEWSSYAVPASAGTGNVWQLQDQSDEFQYTAEASNKGTEFDAKWTDFYHNAWTGPSPTLWQHDHSLVADSYLKIKTSRVDGETTSISGANGSIVTKVTRTGCVTSKTRVVYPVYIEARVKIMNSVLASDVWLLSADDTQEIDICEAYGSDRYTNEWFGPKRVHLSHHVFIRDPFQDWQPSDAGSFYTDGTTIWRNDFHRFGVYWKDPWTLEYYVDGVKVRTRSGAAEIDPNNYTNGEGLSKEMDIIINTEDQTWRAYQGLTPTDEELTNEANNTFLVDWIRIYKPIGA